MIMQDKMEKERMDAKNAVEEYVYEMRNKICSELDRFIKEEVCFLFVYKYKLGLKFCSTYSAMFACQQGAA